jgi:hypothetical protein
MTNANQIQIPYSFTLIQFLTDNFIQFSYSKGEKFVTATFPNQDAAKVWGELEYEYIDFDRQMEEND